MSTASKFAQEFSLLHLETDKTVGSSRLAANLDQALAPVRECLEGLADNGCYDSCWIRWGKKWGDDTYHSSACLAAQQLYERLKQS